MNDPKDVVAFYLQRIESTGHPVEKRIIKRDLFLYYHRLTDAECVAVRPQMQSLLNELQQEVEQKDSLLQRTNEILKRVEARKAVELK